MVYCGGRYCKSSRYSTTLRHFWHEDTLGILVFALLILNQAETMVPYFLSRLDNLLLLVLILNFLALFIIIIHCCRVYLYYIFIFALELTYRAKSRDIRIRFRNLTGNLDHIPNSTTFYGMYRQIYVLMIR